jgi:hypothetical protein
MYDDFVDDYAPPAYDPVASVRAAHSIPHFDNTFTIVDSSFNVLEGGSINSTYLLGVMSMPICIMVIGVLSIIIYQLCLCFRFCCQCCCRTCNAYHPMIVPENDKSIFCVRLLRHRPLLMAFFWICLIFAAVANFCMYIGHTNIAKAFHTGGNSLTALADVLYNVDDATAGLVASANGMYDLMNSQTCDQFFSSDDDASEQLSIFNTSSQHVGGVIGNFPSKIDDARDTFVSYQGMTDLVLFIYFAFILFIILLHVLLTCCRSKAFLNFLIAFTELVVLTLTLVAGVEMIVVVLLGDFCMAPADSTISLILGNASGNNLLTYYLKCEGTNLFIAPLENSTIALYDLNATVYRQVEDARAASSNATLGQACLTSFESNIVSVVGAVTNISHSIQCQPVYNVWNLAINESLCNYAFTGFFTVWLCHLLTAGMLYFVLIAVTWFHEFYKADRVHVLEPPVQTTAELEAGGAEYGGKVEMVTVPPAQVVYANSVNNHIHDPREGNGHATTGMEMNDAKQFDIPPDRIEYASTGADLRNANLVPVGVAAVKHGEVEYDEDSSV